MSRADHPWTTHELQDLRSKAHLGAEALAQLLGRPLASVKMQAYRQRISLRQPGSRVGLVLGQPRRVAFVGTRRHGGNLAEFRAAAVAGEVDPTAIERRAVLLATRTADLCPSCTQAPIEVRSTGLCRACHLRGLADGHRLEARTVAAKRELEALRQSKARTIRGRRADASRRRAQDSLPPAVTIGAP